MLTNFINTLRTCRYVYMHMHVLAIEHLLISFLLASSPSPLSSSPIPLSLQAFAGLVGGLLATGAMTIIELPFWRRWKLQGVLEWHENQILISRLLRSDERRLNYAGIFALHFLNGALGGLGLALALYLIPSLYSIQLILLGPAYGFFLWILTLVPIHKPITGIHPWNHPLGKGPAVASLAGHILYGIVLAVVFLSL
jgi:hypothetical protein